VILISCCCYTSSPTSTGPSYCSNTLVTQQGDTEELPEWEGKEEIKRGCLPPLIVFLCQKTKQFSHNRETERSCLSGRVRAREQGIGTEPWEKRQGLLRSGAGVQVEPRQARYVVLPMCLIKKYMYTPAEEILMVRTVRLLI
jgi:hypothetical protein